ncbi:MAG: prepilin-type N-terminal cleavage/methylation domain-containing protein [Rhodoferax sp.]|nr:prepilin-type N-terminal cleavage/methylation domain-containing protein [Rhodoferax sp.]
MPRRRPYQRTLSQDGFTLVEIAIVLVIIGLILAGILNAQSVLRNARTKDVIKAVNDMSNAAQQFRSRYGAWPGVLTNATTVLPNLSATCVGNTTGRITSAAESACASEELIRASMLRGDAVSPIKINGVITLSLTGAAAGLSGVPGLPASWNNVVRIQAIDCDIAVQIDRLVDDGSTATGNFITGTACPAQTETIAVANAVLRLN